MWQWPGITSTPSSTRRSAAVSTYCSRLSTGCRWRRSSRWGSRSNGFCSTPYPPILGLSLAQWALVAFVLIVVLVPLLTVRNRRALR
ncbi:disulfide bond formation protein B [Pseudomonas gregormendelii]